MNINQSRQPNLSTILMVEKTLENHKDKPLTIAKLKTLLPKQIMHQTLKTTLDYLWKSGKIIYGSKGFQWTFSTPEQIKILKKEQ